MLISFGDCRPAAHISTRCSAHLLNGFHSISLAVCWFFAHFSPHSGPTELIRYACTLCARPCRCIKFYAYYYGCKSTGSGQSFRIHNFQPEVFNHSSKRIARGRLKMVRVHLPGQVPGKSWLWHRHFIGVVVRRVYSPWLPYTCLSDSAVRESPAPLTNGCMAWLIGHTIRKSVGSKTTLSSRHIARELCCPHCCISHGRHNISFVCVLCLRAKCHK